MGYNSDYRSYKALLKGHDTNRRSTWRLLWAPPFPQGTRTQEIEITPWAPGVKRGAMRWALANTETASCVDCEEPQLPTWGSGASLCLLKILFLRSLLLSTKEAWSQMEAKSSLAIIPAQISFREHRRLEGRKGRINLVQYNWTHILGVLPSLQSEDFRSVSYGVGIWKSSIRSQQRVERYTETLRDASTVRHWSFFHAVSVVAD